MHAMVFNVTVDHPEAAALAHRRQLPPRVPEPDRLAETGPWTILG